MDRISECAVHLALVHLALLPIYFPLVQDQSRGFKVLPTIIFCFVGQTPPETCSGDIEKNEMINSIMKRQVFITQLSFRMFFLVCFEKISSSIPMSLVMLFSHVGKRSNSCSQLFFKLSLFKNFAIFTEKHLC